MRIDISLPGGARADAAVGGFLVRTDQPPALGGEDAAPSPYTLFLASLGTCAGFFVARFCTTRGIPVEGIRLVQHVASDPTTHLAGEVRFEIHVPSSFPEKYRAALVKVVDQCSVKRTMQAPPTFATEVVVEGEAAEPVEAPAGEQPHA